MKTSVETLRKAFRNACIKGKKGVVKSLLKYKRVNPASRDDSPIILASGWGRYEVVKLLLSDNRVNPASQSNEAIKVACWYGHTNVVKLLLQDSRVNPLADDSEAIELARENGHDDIVKLLEEQSTEEARAYKAHLNSVKQDGYSLEFVPELMRSGEMYWYATRSINLDLLGVKND